MNMHYGLITIDFSDTMMSTSFDATKITLQNVRSYYNCTGAQTRANGDCSVTTGAYRKVISENKYTKVYNATSLYVTLNSADYSDLLLETSIATSTSNTYLIMGVNATKSTSKEWAAKIEDGSAHPAGTYVADELSPMFRSWTMDMNTGVMDLTFAEPVNISSFNAEAVNFQAAMNLGIEPNANTIALTNTNITKLSGDGATISVNIGTYNLNRVKALYPLGTEHSLLYLSMSGSCVNDIAGNANSLAFVSIYEGKNPTSYTPDTTIPYLDHYDLDMNAEILTLYFTETVNAFQLSVEGITIQEATDRMSATHYNLTTASTKPSTDPNWIVKIALGKADVDAIKLLDMAVASSDAKTYITFKSSFTRDMSVSPHLEISPLVDNTNPMNVFQFTPDATSPSLVSYVLDMNDRKLDMTFNEPVRANTLLVTYLTVQDNVDVGVNGGNKVALTSASTSSSPNGLTISINLCDADFNSLKLQPAMALSAATTFLTFADFNNLNAIQDMILPANNLAQIVDGQAFNPVTFVSDQSRPTLLSYTMNMNSGALNFTFSEPCDASTLNVSAIVFQSQQKKVVCNAFGQCSVAGEVASSEHRLRASSSTVENTDALTIRVNVGVDDMNSIKIIDGFYSSLFSSYLAANQDMVMDIADYDSTNTLSQNGLNEVPQSSAMQANTWKPDVTSPLVSYFSLNMDTGILAITFDEPVRASTFNATGITLVSDADNDINTTSIPLSGDSMTFSSNGLTIDCELSYDDINSLKLATSSFISAETSYLQTDPRTVNDMAGPPGNPLKTAATPPQAILHTPDSTQPKLLSFDYDPVNYNFTFHFDEPVKVSTFDPTALTIQDLGFASQELTLADAVAVGVDGISISAYFGPTDKANFASAGTFFYAASNSFVRFTNGLIKDVAASPNTIVSVSDGSALQLGPTFFMFTIDMDSGLLLMRFSEPVLEFSLDPTKIILQDSATATTSYTLTGMSSTSMLHKNYTIAATLTTTDMNAIKVLPSFYSGSTNAYIRFSTGAVKDVVEGDFLGPNDLIGIADGSAVQASAYRDDITDVEVVDFTLDMNTATLTINFNEPVVASSFDPTKVTLHGAQNGDLASTNSYTLSAASSTASVNGMQLIINVENNGGLDQDFDEIQYLRQMATSSSDTFLSITKEAVIDMSTKFNQLVPIASSSALAASAYTADTTMPTLLSFDLNMDSKTLTLTFSEVVYVDNTFDIQAITIQNSATSSTSDFTLTADTVISSETVALSASKTVPAVGVVKLIIGENDLDAIKSARYLAASVSSTFISIGTSLTKDISPSNNTFVAIPATSAMQVSTYTADSVSPNLLNFTLDMDAGAMTFTFDEMVDPLTLDPTQLTLQYALFTGNNAQKFTLQTSTITDTSSVGKRSLGITLSADDLNNIKILTGLATQKSDTFAIISTSFVRDMSANLISQLRDGKSQLVSTYTPDTTRPIVQSFQLGTSGKIVIRFSEAVQVSSFNSTAVMISDVDQTNAYTLTSFTSVTATEALSTKLTLSLGQDFIDMQQANVGVGQLTSYMSCSEYVITDFNGNKVMPIAKSNAVLMGPALESFDLDMNNKYITMRFTEELEGNFSASAITFVGGTSGAHSYTLTDWNHTTHSSEPFQPTVYISPASTTVKVFLHPTDVEKLKEIGNVATKVENTFITLTATPPLAYNEDTTSVGSPLFVVPITAANALQVTSYTADVEPPALTGYDIDKNAGTLTMRFSEPVNLKTFNATSVTIQADEERGTGTNFVTLGATGTSVTRTGQGGIGSTTISITLGQYDLGKIRSLNLGQYLTLTATAAKDMSIPPNAIVPIADGGAMAVTTLTPDTTGPSIVSYSLDMQLGLITLVFDEPIDSSTIKPEFISFQGVATSPTALFNLTADTLVTSNVEETVVLDMRTFRTDLDGLKSSMLDNIASSLSETFLSVKAGAFKDYNSNSGGEIHPHTALQASGYTPDIEKPVLKSFDIEITDNSSPLYGKMTLHFSEPVDPTTLVFADFVLSDGASTSADTNTLSLASSTAGATASSSVDITLDATELSTIQGYGWANVFLTIAEGAASDVSGNLLAAIDHIMIGPVLEFAVLSMAKGSETINFIFSEPVDPTTFDPTGITIHSAFSAGDSHTLGSTSVLSTATLAKASTKFLDIEIGAKDIEALKSYEGLAVSVATTNIVLDAKTIKDTAATANTVVPVSQASAMTVNAYTPDSSVPVLNSARLDLSLNELTFFFDEPVLASSIKPNQITLQSKSTRTGSTDYYTLSDTHYVGGNNATVNLVLGFNDMSNIKSKEILCTNVTSCYASFTADTFVDTALVPNSLPIVKPTAGRIFDTVLADTKAPNLASFEINLDTDELTLNFDEPVVKSTFKPWKVTMQKTMTNIGGTIYTLPSNSIVTTSNGLPSSSTLIVDLPVTFVEAIMLDTGFAIDKFTLFLMLVGGTTEDTSGNNVTQIVDGLAMPATTYTPDTTPPSLVEFKLDMNLGTATFTFTEFVRIQQVDIGSVTFTNSTFENAVAHTFALGSTLQQTVNNTKTVVVVLTEQELNALKDITNLATEKNNTFVKIAGNGFIDMGGNGNTAMENVNAFQCTTYTPDQTTPKLDQFDLNLNTGRITLRFTESVDESTFLINGLKLHNFAVKRYGNVFDLISPAVSSSSGSSSNEVYIDLTAEEMASLQNKDIGLSRDTTWLTLDQGTIKDMVGLSVDAVLEDGIQGGESMMVLNLVLDFNLPSLSRFRLDRLGKNLHLFMSEPITVLDFSLIRLENQAGDMVDMTNATYMYKAENTEVVIDVGSVWSWGYGANKTTVSLWDKLVAIGADDSSNAMYCTIASNAMKDRGVNENMNNAVVRKTEQFPTCTCPAGQFIKTPCNTIDDAVCSVCTTCSSLGQFYTISSCKPDVDTQCKMCTPCGHGYYPTSPCGGGSDNVCGACTPCGDMEYEVGTCEGGVNRLCATCKVCEWANEAQEVACGGKSKSWKNENCCFDSKGNQIKCKNVDFANLEIKARNGRHHWVFPDTTPEIVGYRLGEWNGQ